MYSICHRRFVTLRFEVRGGRGLAHGVAYPWVPKNLPLTRKVYLLPLTVSELFSWLQKRLRPSDPDRMTNTALEAIASSSGKNEY